MHRWTSFLGALMLVLFIWTSSSAHAAQRFDCIPASSDAAGHFKGDRDEAPAKGEKEVAHHHSGCSSHHLGTAAGQVASLAPSRDGAIGGVWDERAAPSHLPDTQLRPPIA